MCNFVNENPSRIDAYFLIKLSNANLAAIYLHQQVKIPVLDADI